LAGSVFHLSSFILWYFSKVEVDAAGCYDRGIVQSDKKEPTVFSKFVNKKLNQTPEEGLDEAKKSINSGFTGGVTKLLMGQEFVDKVNDGLQMGQNALDMQKSGQWLAQAGLDGTAEVLSIEDTGALVNMNPIVKMKLTVTPIMMGPGIAFETTTETMVSKIAIPRVGDTIKVKYSPTDPTQVVVV
jgi:hypothetical protein